MTGSAILTAVSARTSPVAGSTTFFPISKGIRSTIWGRGSPPPPSGLAGLRIADADGRSLLPDACRTLDERAIPDVNFYNAPRIDPVPKTDYAINAGDVYLACQPGPASVQAANSKSYSWPNLKQLTGVAMIHGNVRPSDISDGLSNTYLLGEKWVDSWYYESYWDLGYAQNGMSGMCLTNTRWGGTGARARRRRQFQVSRGAAPVEPCRFPPILLTKSGFPIRPTGD